MAEIDKRTVVLEASVLFKEFKEDTLNLFRRNRFVSLKNVSFSVHDNEVFALVGNSGAGKTTLCKILLGLMKPDRGDIYVYGQNLDQLLRGNQDWFRNRCQAIFQDPKAALSPRKKIRELLYETLLFEDKKNKNERLLDIFQLIEQVGLKEYHLERYPNQLSGGEAQRVCIARALLRRPQLLICDEPTSNLDVTTEAEILNLIKDVKKRYGLTVLFITHNLSIVRNIADTVGVLRQGELVGTFKVSDIYMENLIESAILSLNQKSVVGF